MHFHKDGIVASQAGDWYSPSFSLVTAGISLMNFLLFRVFWLRWSYLCLDDYSFLLKKYSFLILCWSPVVIVLKLEIKARHHLTDPLYLSKTAETYSIILKNI